MSDRAEIRLNGEARGVAAGTSLASLVAQLGFDSRTLLVEYNGEPLPRDRWDVTALAQGDRVELFRVSAGG
ncbi:MAG: sulfur carrier protein ThiS [Verrucomicrobiae bacterium]|nr:sulfur carrier protein ThiS [Verrucomicrobiae bacterium]